MAAPHEPKRVSVDRDVCEAAGLCTRFLPEVFELSEDDVLSIDQEALSRADPARVDLAVRRCPKQALVAEPMSEA